MRGKRGGGRGTARRGPEPSGRRLEMRGVEGFPRKVFEERRTRVFRLLEEWGGGVLVLAASTFEGSFSRRGPWSRSRKELFYLTGWSEPGAVLFLGNGLSGPSFVMAVPPRDPAEERWEGPRSDSAGVARETGADEVFATTELDRRAPALLEGGRWVFHRLGSGWEGLDRLVLEALSRARARGSRRGANLRGVVDPGELLNEMRLRKDQGEQEALRRAAQLGVRGFREALAWVRPGVGEWEVEARLEAAFRIGGASGAAFPTIAAGGSNACILHYTANAFRLGRKDLLLVDGGPEVARYCGDLTRTVPVAGRFTRTQRAVYEVVLAAREAALEAVRPGGTVGAVHEACLRELIRGLVDLKVLEGSRERLLQDRAYEPFFPHQTSHWLGLEVHDPGDYVKEGKSRELEPGMVLTLEPALYFPPGLPAVPHYLQGLGVRVEDMVLVTPHGRDNLTADLPTAPDEVGGLVGVG